MEILELFKAAIIGIIEGITEWLPISSTGHMILADEFVKLDVSPEFWEMFLVVIQLGAICAVILLFFNKLNPFSPSKRAEGRKKTWILWAKVVVGCIPAAVIGIALDDFFEEHFYNAITVSIALIVYGVAFIVIERIKGADDSASDAQGRAPGREAAASGRASDRGETAASASGRGTQSDRGAAAASDRGEDRGTQSDRGAASASGRGTQSDRGATAGRRAASAAPTTPTSAAQATPAAQRRVGRHSPAAIAERTGTGQAPTSALQDISRSSVARSSNDVSRQASQSHSARPAKRKGDVVTTVDELGFGRAIAIGLFQCLAIIPGTSRSGSTILGGRILGVSREAAAEFSFFLAIPVMFGWSFLKVVKGFVLDDLTLTTTEWGVFAVGIVVAFLVSVFAIRFLMNFIRNHSFEVFGWYRIALGVVVIAFFAFTGQLFLIQ